MTDDDMWGDAADLSDWTDTSASDTSDTGHRNVIIFFDDDYYGEKDGTTKDELEYYIHMSDDGAPPGYIHVSVVKNDNYIPRPKRPLCLRRRIRRLWAHRTPHPPKHKPHKPRKPYGHREGRR